MLGLKKSRKMEVSRYPCARWNARCKRMHHRLTCPPCHLIWSLTRSSCLLWRILKKNFFTRFCPDLCLFLKFLVLCLKNLSLQFQTLILMTSWCSGTSYKHWAKSTCSKTKRRMNCLCWARTLLVNSRANKSKKSLETWSVIMKSTSIVKVRNLRLKGNAKKFTKYLAWSARIKPDLTNLARCIPILKIVFLRIWSSFARKMIINLTLSKCPTSLGTT